MLDETQIKEGMTVYTDTDDKLGTVEYVKFGDEDLNHHGFETETAGQTKTESTNIIRILARGIAGTDELPEEIRANLLRYGYFRLKTGKLFESDYYVPLNLVNDIVGESIHIHATKDDLVAA